jgi:hypothetical protein
MGAELSNPCANLTWKTPRNKSCLENHKRERKGIHPYKAELRTNKNKTKPLQNKNTALQSLCKPNHNEDHVEVGRNSTKHSILSLQNINCSNFLRFTKC